MPPTICVAIVTARENEHTSYDRWHSLREAFLDGRATWADPANLKMVYPLWDDAGRCAQPALLGEFGALLTSCLAAPCECSHIEYQLRALELQTHIPNDVLVVSRYPWPDLYADGPPNVRWVPPMLSDREAQDYPLSRLSPALEVTRARPISYGCADKNTAVVLNRCDYLLMLDDCCLPSPGTVAAAYEACRAGRVLLLGHKKLSFARPGEPPQIVDSTSNWDPRSFANERNVFGIFAAPTELILDLNGWNVQLDGGVHDLDVELKFRADLLLRMRGGDYSVSRSARVYEIDHEHPWSRGDAVPWRPAGDAYPVRAPGPDLRALRTAALAEMRALEVLVAAQETREREDDDGED